MTEQRTPRRRATQWIAQAVGVVAVFTGGAILTAQLVAPEEVESFSGVVVGSVRGTVQEAIASVTDEPPVVVLGAAVSNEEIDTAPHGIFPQMQEYTAAEGLQPVYAAHNGSGGDIILPWELGQAVTVTHADGSKEEMVVTDVRDTSQFRVTTKDIFGMSGSILLQTCYWDRDDMKFVALTPVGEEPVTPQEATGEDTALIVP